MNYYFIAAAFVVAFLTIAFLCTYAEGSVRAGLLAASAVSGLFAACTLFLWLLDKGVSGS